MWNAIKVYGVNYSWRVQGGALRVYDEDDSTSPHERRFRSLYRYDERLACYTSVHVADGITQQAVGAYIRMACKRSDDWHTCKDGCYKLK